MAMEAMVEMREVQLDGGMLEPASGCLFQRQRITKPCPEAARKMVMAEAAAGNKPAGSGIETAAATGKPKPAVGKKTKMVRVKQAHIDALLARRPRTPFPYIPEEIIQLEDPEEQEITRARQAWIAAYIKRTQDEEDDILEQYRVKGYAETEVEVRDVDDEVAA